VVSRLIDQTRATAAAAMQFAGKNVRAGSAFQNALLSSPSFPIGVSVAGRGGLGFERSIGAKGGTGNRLPWHEKALERNPGFHLIKESSCRTSPYSSCLQQRPWS
jgi:predicted phage gp36 major capsid-like protein